MEAEGHRILKLNIGNPAPFGFEAPEEILQDVIRNLPTAHGYGDSKGLLSRPPRGRAALPGAGRRRRRRRGRLARQRRLRADLDVAAGAARQRRRGAHPGAGLSAVDGRGQPVRRRGRCTTAATRAPTGCPTSTTSRAKITAAHQGDRHHQPEQPDRRGLPRRMLESIAELARRHNLVVFSDEIYDKILYDGAEHTSHRRARPGPALPDLQRAVEGVPGGRLPDRLDGRSRAQAARRRSYIEGLTILANMRLCPNVPAQHAVQTALGGCQSINDLVLPGGRLRRAAGRGVAAAQRDPRRLAA